jgi:hypothetical protein
MLWKLQLNQLMNINQTKILGIMSKKYTKVISI